MRKTKIIYQNTYNYISKKTTERLYVYLYKSFLVFLFFIDLAYRDFNKMKIENLISCT